MRRPDEEDEFDRPNAARGPWGTSSWLLVPIAFFLGAAITVTLLVGFGGGSNPIEREAASVDASSEPPAELPTSTGTSAAVTLANEELALSEERLQYLRARRASIEARLAAKNAKKHGAHAHEAHQPTAGRTGGSEPATSAPQTEDNTLQQGNTRRRAPKNTAEHGRSGSSERRSARELRQLERSERRAAREEEHEGGATNNGSESRPAARTLRSP